MSRPRDPDTATEVPPFRADDEHPHAPVGVSTAPWVDTWWFVCRDTQRDVIVETHLTLSPTHGAGARAATLIRRGARELNDAHHGPAVVTATTHGTSRVSVQVDDGSWTAAKRLRLQADLPDGAVDLRLAGRFDAADFTRLVEGFLPVDASSGGAMRNAQHGMTFDGWIELDGERTAVEGFAMRDRSWGWRQNNEMFRHGWVALLGHTRDTVYSVVGLYAGDARDGEDGRKAAWISSADGVAVAAEATLAFDPAGIPIAATIVAVDGRRVEVSRDRHVGATYLSFHDAVPGTNEWVITMMNHHLQTRDADGHAGWAYCNIGNPMRSLPLEGMTLFPDASS